MADQRLSIQLALAPSRPRSGMVTLHNAGSQPLRVWRTGNEWGDGALSFEAELDGSTQTLTRRPQVYTRNVPSSVELAPGDGHELWFDLEDGSWQPPDVVGRLDHRSASLTAVYRITPSPEAREQDVWIGEVRSAPAALG